MKILVPIKRVIDPNVPVRVKADGFGVVLDNVKMSINSFDEVALEQAVRLKEAGLVSEVIAVSCGTHQDVLRTALALGADRGILLETAANLQSLVVARLLRALVQREQVPLVICGKQSIDDDAGQTAPMLAALLNWPQACAVSQLEVQAAHLHLTREIDGGVERLVLALPAVISADLRLNEPRFATLPNIMKAKKKPVDVITPNELGVSTDSGLRILHVAEPAKRAAGIKVADVAELLHRLKHEAKVIL